MSSCVGGRLYLTGPDIYETDKVLVMTPERIHRFTYHDRTYSIYNPGSHIGKILSAGTPYELPLLEDMYNSRIEGSRAIDVGAHVGNHSLWLSAICRYRVSAFEASVANHELLHDNVTTPLNSHLDITVHNVALGDTPGYAKMVGTASDILWGKSPVEYGTGSILVRTLDSYGFDNVSLIKIDVEGNEPYVLRGALETIKRSSPVVYTEAATDGDAQRCEEILSPLGYERTAVFGATPMLRWDRVRLLA